MRVLATPGRVAEPGQRGYPLAWWGMVTLIATEAMIFAALLSAYFFVRAGSPTWPQGGIEPPELLPRVWIFTALLLGSSLPVFWAEHGVRHGRIGALRVGLAVSWVMGAAFIVNQVLETKDLDFSPRDNAYASLFIVITGLHGLHVIAGLVISGVVQLKARLGSFDADRHVTVSVFALYWHFVDVVWIAVFTSLYLTSHL